jgi:hypothetical protein
MQWTYDIHVYMLEPLIWNGDVFRHVFHVSSYLVSLREQTCAKPAGYVLFHAWPDMFLADHGVSGATSWVR